VYNLIVAGGLGTWDESQSVLDRSRVGEYTDDALKARYRVLDERAIAELVSFPTLFAYEKVHDAPARLGRVTHIATRGRTVRFEYEFDNVPGIASMDIVDRAAELDIDDWELNRTHWAVKDVDLADVLVEAGLLQRDVARLPETLTPVAQPTLSVTSLIVERALRDAETLIEINGAASGVDRVHTALHGYLIAVSERAGLELQSDMSITQLFKLVRESHPAFQETGPRAEDIQRMVRALATIVDVLNTVRNQASAAHPNPALLDEPEAMLVVNSVRSILYYVDSRVRRENDA
jgi:hypothetical protein